MDSVLVLKTELSTTTVEDVARYLKKEKSKTIAICNANTLVRGYRNSIIQEKINSFNIKAPDGFPVAKSSKILYKIGDFWGQKLGFCSQIHRVKYTKCISDTCTCTIH